MPTSKNALSIPNISRCLKFACDKPEKIISFATVSPIFRETIIDFKQAEILLENLKEQQLRCILMMREKNLLQDGHLNQL